jgi:hypothetical protein
MFTGYGDLISRYSVFDFITTFTDSFGFITESGVDL